MTLNIIDITTLGDPDYDDCTPLVNEAMAQGGKLWTDTGNVVPTVIKLAARFPRFDMQPNPIPDGVMFDFLPARLTCLVKNFDAKPDQPFWLKQFNLCDFSNCHIFNNRIGGLAYKDLTGFSRSESLSVSIFGSALWDNGAVFDGSALVGYGNRNMNFDHLRIAGCRLVSLRFRCAKAIHGNINVIGGWKTDPKGWDVVFEGPDLATPSDNVNGLSGTFGNVFIKYGVALELHGAIASLYCEEGYNVVVSSDVCEDPANGVTTVVKSWKPTVRVHRPNYDYPAITMAKPTATRRGEAEEGETRPIGKIPKEVQKIMNQHSRKPKGEDFPELAKAFRKQHKKFI